MEYRIANVCFAIAKKLDKKTEIIYNIYIRLRTSIDQSITTRGCTGFDGDFEVGEAIRGPGPRSKPELKIKRKR